MVFLTIPLFVVLRIRIIIFFRSNFGQFSILGTRRIRKDFEQYLKTLKGPYFKQLWAVAELESMAIFFVYPTEKYHSAYSPNAQYEEKKPSPVSADFGSKF